MSDDEKILFRYLKLWDMRRICFEGKHSPLSKLNCDQIHNFGFGDIIENPESTLLYASGLNNVIYCFALDTTDTGIITLL